MNTVSITRSELYQKIERIILTNCDLDDLGIDKIEENHRLNSELGIDSVDFLNVIFDIEAEFKIKIPSEEWIAKASQTKPGDASDYFMMSNFVDNVEELILNGY